MPHPKLLLPLSQISFSFPVCIMPIFGESFFPRSKTRSLKDLRFRRFLMIWVLLQSESPWQRNDAITFFIYLCVSLYQEFFDRNNQQSLTADSDQFPQKPNPIPDIREHLTFQFQVNLKKKEKYANYSKWI